MKRLYVIAILGLGLVALGGCTKKPGTGGPVDPNCPAGQTGCSCRTGSICDDGLTCSANICQPCTAGAPGCTPACQAGTENCACGPQEVCGANLSCVNGQCVQTSAGCTAGAKDCLCGAGNTCDTGLACVDGSCRLSGQCDGSTCGTPHVTCATLPQPCPSGQSCVEATPTADAFCQADSPQNSCPACTASEGVVAGPGLQLSNGTCICQTQPGYYWSLSGSIGAVPCDADGDGWVRSSARFYLNHTDPVLRENARCDLHVVNEFDLHNDLGQTLPVGLGTALPLYESVRNDDQALLDNAAGTPQLPTYGTARALRANELNSLTKACVGDKADHNDNKVADVAEWGRPPSLQVPVGDSSDLVGELKTYFEVYTRYSYFLELDRGWFEPGPPGSPGRYHVAERDRRVSSGGGFPLRYGVEPTSGALTSNYWQVCHRARDSWYAEDKPPIGMDFASLSAPSTSWKGMTHHSQFKCVQVVDDVTLGAPKDTAHQLQTVTMLGEPQDPAPAPGCVAGKLNCTCDQVVGCDNGLECNNDVCRIPRRDYLRSTVNVCEVDAAPSANGDPAITCQAKLPSQDEVGKVVWAAVRISESSQYARGCLLQCPGYPFICPGGDASCYSMCGGFSASAAAPFADSAGTTIVTGEAPFHSTTANLLGQRGAGNGYSIQKR